MSFEKCKLREFWGHLIVWKKVSSRFSLLPVASYLVPFPPFLSNIQEKSVRGTAAQFGARRARAKNNNRTKKTLIDSHANSGLVSPQKRRVASLFRRHETVFWAERQDAPRALEKVTRIVNLLLLLTQVFIGNKCFFRAALYRTLTGIIRLRKCSLREHPRIFESQELEQIRAGNIALRELTCY